MPFAGSAAELVRGPTTGAADALPAKATNSKVAETAAQRMSEIDLKGFPENRLLCAFFIVFSP
jgi:hypothetical protein